MKKTAFSASAQVCNGASVSAPRAQSRRDYAVKFFYEPEAFEREAELYANATLRSMMAATHDVCSNSDGARTAPNRYRLPPFIVIQRGESLDEWQKCAATTATVLAFVASSGGSPLATSLVLISSDGKESGLCPGLGVARSMYTAGKLDFSRPECFGHVSGSRPQTHSRAQEARRAGYVHRLPGLCPPLSPQVALFATCVIQAAT